MRAVNLGLGTNIGLAALKTFIGITGHSPALLAEGINSTSDVAYYVVASVFVRMANKPADEEHPYGHQQLESIAAVVVGSFIVTTAVAVFWDALDKIWDLWTGITTSQGASNLALWMALATVAIKIFMTYYIRRLGKETSNPVVEAMAEDHRNDMFSAAAASLGVRWEIVATGITVKLYPSCAATHPPLDALQVPMRRIGIQARVGRGAGARSARADLRDRCS